MARLSSRDETRLKQYEELLNQEPNALVFAALASLYARKYDFWRAIDILNRGLSVYPNYFSARVLLAKCYIALDRFETARQELETILTADPYNVQALGLLADELRNRGRFGEARERYLEIIEFEPDNEEYAYKLELLETLMEGGPFGEKEAGAAPAPAPRAVTAAAVAPPPAKSPAPAIPAPPAEEPPPPPAAVEAPPPPIPTPPEIELEPAEIPMPPAEAEENEGAEEFELPPAVLPEPEAAPEAAAPAVPPEAVEEEEEVAAPAEELATLTLAKIYEDQGLFVRAREVIAKVREREPANEAARRADEHLATLLASETSPTGESIIQLIKTVRAAGGILEADELELWEEVSAGVAEALAGFEELTVAQAVAAAAGLRGIDEFTIISLDLPALWEFEVAKVEGTADVAGADELDVELPLFAGFGDRRGVNVARVPTPPPATGDGGREEFRLEPTPAGGKKRAAAAAIPTTSAAPAPAPPPAPGESPDIVFDLKRAVHARKREEAPGPPRIAPEETPPDDLAVKAERYLGTENPSLEQQTFPEKEDDFLGWLDSIKLKEL